MGHEGHGRPALGDHIGDHAETAPPTKRRKRRRVRSPHPGVKIKRRALPSGGYSYRAHYVDPDTGRERAETLDPLALPTKEAREAWAKRLAADLARRRMERAGGMRPAEVSALEEAIKVYIESIKLTHKHKTVVGHELAIAKLREWARTTGVRITADLTPARLAALRDYLIAAPKAGAKRGGKRGARVALADRRSPVTVNRELRSLKAMLNTWRTRGMLPGLHRDDIADTLAPLPTPQEAPAFLSTRQLRALLTAALAHDEATFTETREEHAGQRPKGTTPRYVAIAPFVAFVLLTGMRRSEALAVRWEHVDLTARDGRGEQVGEIRLPASITKTSRARTIGLEVSPALRRILAAWRLARGKARATERVFVELTVDTIEAARARMVGEYGAPAFSWQILRSTCATYLTNAPAIFGSASAFLSARQLGHSVVVAEKHYAGALRGIPRDARTLEAAMQIERELGDVLGVLLTRPARGRRSERSPK